MTSRRHQQLAEPWEMARLGKMAGSNFAYAVHRLARIRIAVNIPYDVDRTTTTAS
jgi:hypothetical protein